jgi:SAM-dependent methyltransferase
VNAPIRTVSVRCPHCAAEATSPLWSGCEHEYENTTDEEFTFVRCAVCGLVRLDPRPDVSELGRIYPPDYYAYNLIEAEAGDGERATATERAKIKLYRRRIEELVARLPGDGPVRLLDVGCADGRLLDWYASSAVGERLQTFGIEMDEAAAERARARGHEVVVGRFEVDTELEQGSFDLILAAHVIEHVADPAAFARRAAALLAPGGLFVVATPNWDSADARRLRGVWGGNHFPRHWTLYDDGSLADLADRVGLERPRIGYQTNPIFWVWSCHAALRRRLPGRRWPDRLFPPVGIFRSSLQSFLLLGLFTVVDAIQLRLTGRTASLIAEFRKPG